jgi:hypothetical protein
MAVIECIKFADNGQIKTPDLLATLRAKSRLAFPSAKFFPTFDIGYAHVFRISAHGLTFDEAQRNAKRKLDRFHKKMHLVEGFCETKVDKIEDYIRTNQNFKVIYTIMYVIEQTGSGTQNPDSPYPEYQLDLTKLQFPPETAAVLSAR